MLERNDIMEQGFRRTLKDIDSLLDVRWFPFAGIDPRTGVPEGRYAIVSRWADADERWSMHQAGDIGDPFDLLGYVQVDPSGDLDPHSGTGTPVSLDQMTDMVIDFLGKMDNTRTSWRERMEATVRHNKNLRDERKNAIVEETVEEVKYQRKKMAGEPIVNLGGALPDIPNQGAQHE